MTALNQLSFAVPEGSVYGLLGANGAGKTTALKLLMNLHEPTSGEATVLGIDSRKLQGRHFEQIGYVSENQDQPGWMTLGYLLEYLKPFYPTWDDARAAELVEQFRLPLDRKIKHFSRGMQMKASLASSMAYRPKLLILDEPFSGLDPLTREELIEALLEGAGETSIVVSSHDLADIESFASHIGYLDRGKLEFSEELSELSARFREMEVTLAEPALPAPWPAHWLRPEASPAVVRFVETHFDPDRTMGEIRLLFRGVTNIEAHPMPLRSIFVTLARTAEAAHRAAA
jgi:ABC-2 type transport system ATP-binding protein